jgi:hypothetical protein
MRNAEGMLGCGGLGGSAVDHVGYSVFKAIVSSDRLA